MVHKPNLTCDICKTTFLTKDGICEHFDKHHKMNFEDCETITELSCRKCDYEGNTEDEIKNHMKEHLTFKCNNCQFISETENELKRHNQIIHQITKIRVDKITPENDMGANEIVCEKCEYKCKLNIQLKNHKKRKHTNEVTYQCNFCDFQSSIMIKMCEHKLFSHPEVDPEFNPKTITPKEMILNLIAEQNKELISEVLVMKKYLHDLHDKVEKLSQDSKDTTKPIPSPVTLPTNSTVVQPVCEEVFVPQPAPSIHSETKTNTRIGNTKKNTMKQNAYLKKPKILIVGDSITHNANFANIEKDTKSRIRTMKAHSSVRDSRARWSHKNHADVTPKALKAVHEGDEYEYLVIGAPTVDITNIDTSQLSPRDNIEVYKQMIITSCHNTFATAHNAIEDNPNLKKVAITEHPPRFDEYDVDPTGLKPKLAEFANITFNQMWHNSEHKNKIVIGNHNLECVGDQLEARYRDENTKKYDGVHMYGFFGMRAYTRSLTQIIRNILPASPAIPVSQTNTSMAAANHITCPQAMYQQSRRYAVPVHNKFSILGN